MPVLRKSSAPGLFVKALAWACARLFGGRAVPFPCLSKVSPAFILINGTSINNEAWSSASAEKLVVAAPSEGAFNVTPHVSEMRINEI